MKASADVSYGRYDPVLTVNSLGRYKDFQPALAGFTCRSHNSTSGGN